MSSRATSGRACRRRAAAGLAAGTVVALAACQADSPEPPPDPPETSVQGPTNLTIGVHGAKLELAALRASAENFDGGYDGEVQVLTWRTSADLVATIEEGAAPPDVFLVSRDDLAWLREQELTQPVDTLLDERGVDFGDGYSRDALQAFSSDDRLQCMPYGISPMVMYYNKELVDFDRMDARGMLTPEPDPETGLRPFWSFDNFAVAVEFATRPRRGTRGVHVEPRVRDLSPFVYSGGGQVFDDADDPTSLAFSEGDSRDAMEQSLEVLRSPQLTLTEDQLAERTPLEWFERGKLAIFPGYREHLPQLRLVPGLDFDVISMPILDSAATIGDITGLCLSAEAANAPAAADLMVHMLSAPAVERVVRTGYLVPANQEVALSEEFLQPGRLPQTSTVFNESVRSIVVPPLLSVWPELEAAVDPSLEELFTVPVLSPEDLDARLQEVDELSQPVLDPEGATPSEDEG